MKRLGQIAPWKQRRQNANHDEVTASSEAQGRLWGTEQRICPGHSLTRLSPAPHLQWNATLLSLSPTSRSQGTAYIFHVYQYYSRDSENLESPQKSLNWNLTENHPTNYPGPAIYCHMPIKSMPHSAPPSKQKYISTVVRLLHPVSLVSQAYQCYLETLWNGAAEESH